MPQVRFTVEQAGCPSCAERIGSALALVTAVEAIEIDEDADLMHVTLDDTAPVSEVTVAQALDAASDGSGHAYRVRPGSWSASAT